MLYPFNPVAQMYFFVGVYPDGQARSWHVRLIDLDDYVDRYLTGLFPFDEVQIATCPDAWSCNCDRDFLAVKRAHGGRWPEVQPLNPFMVGAPAGAWHPSMGVNA